MARRVAFWLVPGVLLALILSRIDFRAFRTVLSQARVSWVLLGILCYPAVIVVGALRWRLLLNRVHARRVPVRFALTHYWAGLAFGFLAPASIGWDLYRVVVAGRRFGRYVANGMAVVVEKSVSLAVCAALVLAVYPLLDGSADDAVKWILRVASLLLAALLLVFLALALARGPVAEFVTPRIRKALDRANVPRRAEAGEASPLGQLLSWGLLAKLASFSLSIQFVTAIGNLIFFRAVQSDLPFLVNLFVIPVLVFVFLLPISFGSIGIREGAYVLLYGMFGVAPETALLVSFFNLAGLLLNATIGGILMLWVGGRTALRQENVSA